MRITLIFFLCLFAQMMSAQEVALTTTQNKEEAILTAQNKNARILMVFAGSDWCRPCMKFKKDVLDSDEFQAFAAEKFVILYLDFPSKRGNQLSKEQLAHNEALAEKYNASGTFPKLLLLDQNFNKISEITYEGQDANTFIQQVKSL